MIIYPRHIRIPTGGPFEYNCTITPGDASFDEAASYFFEMLHEHRVYRCSGVRVLAWDYVSGLLTMLPSFVAVEPEPGWMEVEINGSIELREIDHIETDHYTSDGRPGVLPGIGLRSRVIPKLRDGERVVSRVGISTPLIVHVGV